MADDDLKAIFRTAIDHHRAGKLAEAEPLYRHILSISPDHVEALHHLGIVALQCGQPQVAAQLIGRSVSLAPSPASLNNFGEALRALGQLPQAIDCYQKSIALDPRQMDAMANLGLALLSINQLPEAERSLRQALSIAPNHVSASIALANVLSQTDRIDETLQAWERVVRLAPSQHVFHRSLGASWIRAGDPYRAITALKRAIELQPKDAEAHARLAMAYDAVNKSDESIAAARKAVATEPNRWQSHHELAGYLQKAGAPAEAIEVYANAINLNPQNASLYGARSKALLSAGRIDEAVESLNLGIKLSPSDPRLYSLLSSVQFAQRDFAAAAQSAQSAVDLDPHSVDGHASLAFALLASGRYEEGFKQYEWRWRDATFTTKPRDFEQPLWDGSDPSGRRILVHCEQGFGDIFQFVRYLPMIRARGAKIIVEASYKVANLIRRMSPEFTVVITGTMLPDFDLHVPLMSLPAIFGTTIETIPGRAPYLSADPTLAAQWHPRLEPGKGLLVGLVWAGSPKPDPKRSAKLADFAALATVPNISFIAMQSEPQAAEANDPPAGMILKNLGPELRDFSDTTASVLANLDLLITIDTGVAHLAGAMGIPTWILLPYAPDWRWALHESLTPWYPTARLFRQTSREEWGPVMERVADALRDRIK